MAVVGSAEVLIRPTFKGMQREINRELGGVGNVAGKQSGSRFGTALAKWGKRGAILAGGGIVAGIGATLTSGFKRLTAIEDAEAMLRGLGHTTDEVSAIMQNAMDSTEGTAIAMDKIAPVAAQMVAAGIEPGKDLEETLRLVGDAAMIAGGDIDGMSAIFGKVAASNRLSMEEVNQIQERGIPILQMIADQMGVNQAAVRDMVSAGEIDFQKFADAMESGVGGSAKEMGETTRASWSNLMAYVARAGAELLSGVLPVVNEAMQGASQFLKSMEPTFRRFGEVAGEKLREGAEGLKTFFQQMRDGEGAGGRFREILSTVGTVLMTVGRVLLNVGQWLNEHRGVVYAAVGAYVAFRAVQAGINFGKWIAGLYKSAAAWVKDTVATLANVKAKVASKLETAALAAMYARQWIATQARAIAGWIRETAVMVAHRVALVAQRGAAIAAAAASKGLAAAQWLINAAMRANPIGIVITVLTALVAGLVLAWKRSDKFREIVTNAWEKVKEAASAAWDWISDVFQNFKDGLSSVGDWFADKGQAMSDAFSSVKDGIADAWSKVSDTWDNMKTGLSDLGGWFSDRGSDIKSSFGSMKDSLVENAGKIRDNVTNFLQDRVQNLASFFANDTGFMGRTFRGLYNIFLRVKDWIDKYVFRPFRIAFELVRSFFSGDSKKMEQAWLALRVYFVTIYRQIINRVTTPFRNAFRAVRDFFRDRITDISNQWQRLKDALRAGYEWIRDRVFNPVRDFIEDKVVASFKKGVDKIKETWERIEGFAKKPIKFVINTVLNDGLIEAFNWIAKKVGLKTIDPIKIKGFAGGGWTGPGSRLTPAGVVHADEFVVQKRSRRRFERENPGLLDHINRNGTMFGYASGGLVRPVRGGTITSGFGASRGRYPHAGIDFAVPVGTSIFAAMAGRVLRAGWNSLTGRTGKGIFLGHNGGRNTYYGHLSKLLVSVGDMVKKGQRIGLSGNTGRSTGPHLHYEIHIGGKPVNPAKYLNGAALPEGAEGGGFVNPLQGLLDLAGGLGGQFKKKFPAGNFMVDLAKATAKKLIGGATDWLGNKIGAIGDWVSDKWQGAQTGAAKAQVRAVAALRGWGHGKQWKALDELIQRESSWNQAAKNPRSSAEGLFQKMTSIHGAVEKTAAGQAKWGLKYIADRYGNPVNALNFHKRRGYYAKGGLVGDQNPMRMLLRDRGGNLPRGLNLVMNNKRHDETVLPHTPRDVERMFLGQRSGRGGVENHYHYHANRDQTTLSDFVHEVDFRIRRMQGV